MTLKTSRSPLLGPANFGPNLNLNKTKSLLKNVRYLFTSPIFSAGKKPRRFRPTSIMPSPEARSPKCSLKGRAIFFQNVNILFTQITLLP